MDQPILVPGTGSVTKVMVSTGCVVVDDAGEGAVAVRYLPSDPARMVASQHVTSGEAVMTLGVGIKPPAPFDEVTMTDPRSGVSRTFEVQGVRQEPDGSIKVRDELGAWLPWK